LMTNWTSRTLKGTLTGLAMSSLMTMDYGKLRLRLADPVRLVDIVRLGVTLLLGEHDSLPVDEMLILCAELILWRSRLRLAYTSGSERVKN